MKLFKSIEDMIDYFGSVENLDVAYSEKCEQMILKKPSDIQKVIDGRFKMNGILARDIANFIEGYYYCLNQKELNNQVIFELKSGTVYGIGMHVRVACLLSLLLSLTYRQPPQESFIFF